MQNQSVGETEQDAVCCDWDAGKTLSRQKPRLHWLSGEAGGWQQEPPATKMPWFSKTGLLH